MFQRSKVEYTEYRVECVKGVWVVASYVKYTDGATIRNWVADGPSQEEAYEKYRKVKSLVFKGGENV
jgi:hypothetical protein